MTTVYFIRHAESPYTEGEERERGLSERGKADAVRVKELLSDEQIDVFVSSPYERAVQTIKPLADERNRSLILVEDLRERALAGKAFIITAEQFRDAKRKVFEDFHYSFLGGESSLQAQKRSIHALNLLLRDFDGQKIAIGTHGDIMTLMLNHFDPQYGFEFWQSTSVPDIYKLQFAGGKLNSVIRMWKK